MSEFPEGFVPAFEYLRTPDGVVEYVHPAGEAVLRRQRDPYDQYRDRVPEATRTALTSCAR